MSRYVAIAGPKAWSWHGPAYEQMTVICDHDPAKTGLVDQHGTPIYRVRDPIGFHVRRAPAKDAAAPKGEKAA